MSHVVDAILDTITLVHRERCFIQGCVYGENNVCRFCGEEKPSDVVYGESPLQTLADRVKVSFEWENES